MRWSFSEFLNLLDTRSQCWGVVAIGPNDGFRVRANEEVMFYAMLDGRATIAGIAGERIALEAGETVMIVSTAAHALRPRPEARLHAVAFLDDDDYGDMPHYVALGEPVAARVLCGRLKVRWPGGLDPHFMPPVLRLAARDNVVDLHTLVRKARGNGAAALLTRAAALMLTAGLRDHPDCESIFRDANFRDPISRAIQYMELHLHRGWTVGMLAAKVGMARSTFAGRFLAEAGRPPMTVLTELRMRRAAELLTQTELKISEIGERVGYHSQSAFCRRFEKHFAMTPGRMRQLGPPPADACP
jgi:AraC-like DNA-binding protein